MTLPDMNSDSEPKPSQLAGKRRHRLIARWAAIVVAAVVAFTCVHWAGVDGDWFTSTDAIPALRTHAHAHGDTALTTPTRPST